MREHVRGHTRGLCEDDGLRWFGRLVEDTHALEVHFPDAELPIESPQVPRHLARAKKLNVQSRTLMATKKTLELKEVNLWPLHAMQHTQHVITTTLVQQSGFSSTQHYICNAGKSPTLHRRATM